MYDIEDVDTVPIVKGKIRQDTCTGTLFDFAMIELNSTYYHVVALEDDYVILNEIGTGTHVLDLVSPLHHAEVMKLHSFLQRHTTSYLALNTSINFQVVIGAFYARYTIIDL